jgi:Fe2+ transport system protein FeoA
MPTSLADMAPGQRGVVTGFARHDDFTHRLLQFGVVEGADIEFLRAAPAGDPIEIRVMGSALSLRRSEAALVLVGEVR